MKYFGTDGIRLSDKKRLKAIIKKLAFAFNQLNAKKIVVGFDERPYGKKLVKTLTKNLSIMGIKTLFVNVVPSACVSYMCKLEKADYGVMITASHNPSHINGIKIFKSNGEKLNTLQEKSFEKIFNQVPNKNINYFLKKHAKDNNISKTKTTCLKIEPYLNLLKQNTPCLKNKTIVLDCSNGASKYLAE